MDWNGFSNFRTVWSVSCLSGSSINTRIPIVKDEFPSNSEFIMRCIRPNRETVSQTRLTHFPILLGRDEHLSYSFSGILHSRSPRPPPPAPAPAAAAKPATNANWFTKAQSLNRWFPPNNPLSKETCISIWTPPHFSAFNFHSSRKQSFFFVLTFFCTVFWEGIFPMPFMPWIAQLNWERER